MNFLFSLLELINDYLKFCCFLNFSPAIGSLPSSQLLHHTQIPSSLALTNNMVHHHSTLLSNGLGLNNNSTANNNNNHSSAFNLNHSTNSNQSIGNHNESMTNGGGATVSSNNSSNASNPPSSPNHTVNRPQQSLTPVPSQENSGGVAGGSISSIGSQSPNPDIDNDGN